MNTLKRVEMIFGFLTALFAIIAAFRIVNFNVANQIILFLIFYLLPALLVTIGSWVHARAGTKSGFFVLFAGGLILILPWVPAFLGAFYVHGLWGGILGLTPGVMAAITMLAAWLSRKSIAH